MVNKNKREHGKIREVKKRYYQAHVPSMASYGDILITLGEFARGRKRMKRYAIG